MSTKSGTLQESALDHEFSVGVIPSRDVESRCPDGAIKRVPYPVQLLDVFQCADYLNVSVSVIRLYVKKGILHRTLLPDPLRPGHKLRLVRINKSEADRLIKESEEQ